MTSAIAPEEIQNSGTVDSRRNPLFRRIDLTDALWHTRRRKDWASRGREALRAYSHSRCKPKISALVALASNCPRKDKGRCHVNSGIAATSRQGFVWRCRVSSLNETALQLQSSPQVLLHGPPFCLQVSQA